MRFWRSLYFILSEQNRERFETFPIGKPVSLKYQFRNGRGAFGSAKHRRNYNHNAL